MAAEKEPVTLLIDADIVAFKAASVCQEKFVWEDGTVSMAVKPIEEMYKILDETLAGYMEDLKADNMIICLSCLTEEGFRFRINPTYKQHRTNSERPVLLYAAKDYMAEKYATYARPGLEADDVMGILSTHPKIVRGKKIIVSEDKDMNTIPGWLYNPAKDTKPRFISVKMAETFHLYQTLIGDSTDGYPGCPDIGPDKARKMLDEPYIKTPYEHVFSRGPRKGLSETRYTKEPTDDLWAGIVSLYEAEGLTEDDAIMQARMARILRAVDYNFKDKEVILWTPARPQ